MTKMLTNKLVSLSLSFLALIIVFCILIVNTYAQDLYISEGFVYALIITSVAFIPILYRIFRNDLNIFEPIVLGLMMLGLLFGVRPIAMYLVGDIEYFLWFPIFDYFDQAVLLGMLGTIMLLLGYTVNFEMGDLKKSKINKSIAITKGKYCSVYIYCFSIFLFSFLMFYFYVSASGSATDVIYMMYSGRSQALVVSLPLRSEYFSVAPILSACAAIVLIVSNKNKKIPLRDTVLIVIFVLFPVIVFLLLGVRRFIIPSIFIPLVVYYLVRNKKPRLKNLLTVAPLIFLLLSVIPYLRTEGARDNMQKDSSNLIEYVFLNVGKHVSRFVLSHDTEMVSALSVEIGALKSAEDYYYGRAVFGDSIFQLTNESEIG